MTSQLPNSVRRSERIPALDGLRGVAVSLVLAAHFVRSPETGGWSLIGRLASSGWIGVDLFFVLSGFLITGILLDTRGNQNYFRAFYGRRALRILPLYYGFLMFILLLPRMSALAQWLGASYLAEHQGWFWSHTANWLLAGEAAHGLTTGADHGFGARWSLAIEEQFYLAWPLAVALVPRRRLLLTIGFLTAGCIVLRLTLAIQGMPAAVLSGATVTRLDGLCVGAALAVLHRDRGLAHWWRVWALGVCGCALMLAAATPLIVRSSHSNAVLYGAVEFPIAMGFGALLMMAVAQPGRMSRAMSVRPLRALGKYSYGIYLIQAPVQHVLVGAGAGPQQVGYLIFMIMGLAVTLGVAFASWHLWEVHFLRFRPFGRTLLLSGSVR
jgi:peptidoglycan/LPS O-acetylase OafA/YrhL